LGHFPAGLTACLRLRDLLPLAVCGLKQCTPDARGPTGAGNDRSFHIGDTGCAARGTFHRCLFEFSQGQQAGSSIE
jgi:hypothetical protein